MVDNNCRARIPGQGVELCTSGRTNFPIRLKRPRAAIALPGIEGPPGLWLGGRNTVVVP